MGDKLYEELVKECERLTGIIDAEEVNSDKWKAAYAKKLDILEKMNNFQKIQNDYWSKDDDRKVQEKQNERMLEMEEKKLELEEKKLKQHEDIERSRRNAELALEQEKQEITWKRVGFEMSKIVIPLAITAIIRKKERGEMFDFETHGRITSSVGRQFRLTDLFWKK